MRVGTARKSASPDQTNLPLQYRDIRGEGRHIRLERLKVLETVLHVVETVLQPVQGGRETALHPVQVRRQPLDLGAELRDDALASLDLGAELRDVRSGPAMDSISRTAV